jgi:hypothetical protein
MWRAIHCPRNQQTVQTQMEPNYVDVKTTLFFIRRTLSQTMSCCGAVEISNLFVESGVFEEGDDASAGGNMNALKNYVMARVLWDPSLNPDELIHAFLLGYYRSAV